MLFSLTVLVNMTSKKRFQQNIGNIFPVIYRYKEQHSPVAIKDATNSVMLQQLLKCLNMFNIDQVSTCPQKFKMINQSNRLIFAVK